MKKIIGFFNPVGSSLDSPSLLQLSPVFEENGEFFIQYRLSTQFFSLTEIVCNLRDKKDIEAEVSAYMAQGQSLVKPRLGNYSNNLDISGNKYYFHKVNNDILTSKGFYPISKFSIYNEENMKIDETNPVYAFVLEGQDAFVGNKDFVYEQLELLLESPLNDNERDFKIDMLYDLEKYDRLSDEVDTSIALTNDSQYKETWKRKKEEGQVLKFVYKKIGHK